MNAWDAIVLTVYLLCVVFFIFKLIKSFNDEFVIQLDEEYLKQHLSEQLLGATSLQDLVGISFKFEKRYEFDALKQLLISITNKSEQWSIYVDWDYSTMTDALDKRSRRVTRLVPGNTLDLFQEQVFSAIMPGTTLREAISTEDILKRKEPKDKAQAVALELDVNKPLLNLSKPDEKAPEAKKRHYTRFMKRQERLDFMLELALRLVGPHRGLGGDRAHVRCRFILIKLPWSAGLPWNPKE